MRNLISSLLGIQRGEGARATLMFLYAMFLLSAYLILKPVRNSLFLEKFGAQELVYMYMAIAVFAAVVVSGFTKLGAKLSLNKFISATTIFIIINLIGFWWLITQQYDWLVYVFYAWVSLFGVITTSQFWLLANHIFDAREAKRIFPFIGAGAITGGLIGSKLTGLLAEALGTEALLWVCIGFLVLIQALVLIVWPMRRKGDERQKARRRAKDAHAGGMWPLIFKDKYLRLLGACIALMVMVATFVDFQFNWIVAHEFPGKDERTAFFGDFFFYLSLVSLGLQLILSSRILRKFGIGVALLVLPVGLLLGSAAIFAWPRLIWSAVLVKISDGSFRYSINKTGLELLYVPVSSAIKSRVKGLMDVVGDRFSRGIAGALLFVCTALLGLSIGDISILSGVLIFVWIIVTIRLRKEYSNSFRAALATRTIEIEDVRAAILRESRSLEELVKALQSKEPRQILYTLELTYGIKDERIKDSLVRLLSGSRADIRCEALKQLAEFDDSSLTDVICPLTNDEDAKVRLEAIRYVCRRVTRDSKRGIPSLMKSSDPEIRATASRCALEEGRPEEAPFLQEDVDRILSDESAEGAPVRRELASAFGSAQAGHPLYEKFERFLQDNDNEVVLRAITGAARLKRRDFVPSLLGKLPQVRLRSAVTDTLVSYGSLIVGSLRDALADPRGQFAIRRRLPRIIALIGGNEAGQILTQQLSIPYASLRYNVIKALGTLRRREPDVEFDDTALRNALRNDAREYYTITVHKRALEKGSDQGPAIKFLLRTLQDRRGIRLEQIFRMTGLFYPQEDMIRAFHGVTSGSATLRAGAIAFLDTIWSIPEKELFFGMLEGNDSVAIAARKIFDIPAFSREETIAKLLDREDPWLAACAANAAREERLTTSREKLKQLLESPHRALKETARIALDALSA